MSNNNLFDVFVDNFLEAVSESAGEALGEAAIEAVVSFATRPKGKILKIWVDHNVYENEKKGMRIHLKFDVQNLKDIPCRAIAYFYFQNGNKLKDYNNHYCTKDGQVSVGKDFTPSYEDSVYKDFTLFMPNDELHMIKGKHHLKFDVDLCVKSIDKHIATSSSYQTFTHTKA